METKTQQGYLVLADISGYTSFVAGTELEHSHEIMTELLELLLRKMTPALTLSKLEGDAVFVYAPQSRFTRGDAVMDLIESTYTAFRDHILNMHHRTTCTCNACRAIPTLDLKFIVHCGEYIIQSVMGNHELIGSDVNLAHRLMKNHVKESTGWEAYALYTEKCLQNIGVEAEGLHPQVESYEHLGDVQTYNLNLTKRYKEVVEVRRVFLEAKDADMVCVQEFNAPPAVVWDWWNNPVNRTLWVPDGHNQWSVASRNKGRTGVGSVNHCEHGGGVSVEKVTDWRPFNYVSTYSDDPKIKITETVIFEPIDDGKRTRIYDHMSIELPIRLPKFLHRPLATIMLNVIVKYKQILQHAADLLDARLKEENEIKE